MEQIIRRNRNGDERVVYMGIPGDASTKKRGPAKSFDHESDARNYAVGWERDRDRVAEAFEVPNVRNRKHVQFADYAEQCAARWDSTKAAVPGGVPGRAQVDQRGHK